MMVEMRDGGTRTRPLLAGFALAHLVIFVGLFDSGLYPLNFSGVGLYFADMNKMFAGQVPYRDFVFEYPPLALLFFAIPRAVSGAYSTYHMIFHAEIILCDFAILALLNAIAATRTRTGGESPRAILTAYTIFVLAIGPIVAEQFDLFATAMVLAAVYFASRNRRTLQWMFLALGVTTKLYPVLLAPAFILRAVRRRDWKSIAMALGISVATCAVVMLPLLIIAPTAITTFFHYHSARGIQVESTYAGILLLLDIPRFVYVGIGSAFGSWNVTGDTADNVARASTFILVAAVAGVCTFLYRELSTLSGAERERVPLMDAVWGSALLVLVFAILATSKVLSPQYMMWALPLVPLVRGPRRMRIWALFTVTCMMTYYIFPIRYLHLIHGDAWDVLLVLIIRNALLVVLALEIARSLRDLVRGAQGHSDVHLTRGAIVVAAN